MKLKNLQWSELHGSFVPGPTDTNYDQHQRLYSPWPSYLGNSDVPFKVIDLNVPKQVRRWNFTDSEKTYLENKRIMPSEWKYHELEVLYDLNEHGYRTLEWKDIDWKNAIVLLGDSCIYGLGLAEFETLAYKLQEYTERPVVNLGFPGSSNAVILENCASLVNNYGIPHAVGISWSTTDRMRYYAREDYHDIGCWDYQECGHKYIDGVDVSKLYTHMFVDEYNQIAYNYNLAEQARAMFQGRCKYATMSFYGYSAFCTRADTFIEIDNQARDRQHPGEECMNIATEFFHDKFK